MKVGTIGKDRAPKQPPKVDVIFFTPLRTLMYITVKVLALVN